MRKLLIPIGSILLLAVLVGLGTACMAVLAGEGGTPTVTTDKIDYTPGDTVQITGSGFEPACDLTIRITRPDATVDSAAVTADGVGGFQYDYVLDGINGQYLVEVLDGAGTVLATATFIDGNVKVLPAPSAVTFTLTKTTYSTTNCSGTPTSGPTSDTVSSPSGDTTGVGSTESVKLQAAATSDQGGAFINWTSSYAFTDLGDRTICVQGFKAGGYHTYTANYSTAPEDLCPDDPDKTEPGICGCGVPDTDTDGDGIADCIDNCPADYNPGQEDCNNNGVGNACDAINPGADDSDCNGVDDDCDGTADDDYEPTDTVCGTGECAAEGELICVEGGLQDTCIVGQPSAEVCDGLDNDCDGSVDEDHVCEADVKIISQEILAADCLSSPPTEIDVGANVQICLHKVLRNDGPYSGDVTVDITKTATAPDDCTITPLSATEEDVVLTDNTNKTVDETFTIHCSQPSEHTFTVQNDVSGPEEPLIVDPDLTNNSASTDLTVDAIAYADLEQIVTVPEEIPEAVVDTDATLHLTAEIKNNGLYGPVWAHNELTFFFPEDGEQGGCTLKLFFPDTGYTTDFLESGQTVDAPSHLLGVDDDPFQVAVDVIAHCYAPGLFPWAGSARLVVDSPHVVDPHLTNNGPPPEDPIVRDVPVIAEVDVAVSQEILDWPENINVSEQVPVTLKKTITATVVPPATTDEVPSVEVDISKTAEAPDGCTIEPTEVEDTQVEVLTTEPTELLEVFYIHCKPSHRGPFTFDNVVSEPKDPFIVDPDLTNNTAETTDLWVYAWAEVDVAVSQQVLGWPTNINVGDDVDVTLKKTITATVKPPATTTDIPQVEVAVTKTATAPTGCTVTPTNVAETKVVSTTSPLVFNETFTIHCKPSYRGPFTFDNVVGEPNDPHISDPTPGNNTAKTTGLYVYAWAKVDVAVSQKLLDWPTEIEVSTDGVVHLEKTITATVKSPATTTDIPQVEVEVTKTAAAPAGCTVTPTSVVEQKVVSTTSPLVFVEAFTIHCDEPSTHGPFIFHNVVGEPKDPHISDPTPGNNEAETQRSVAAIGYSDLKVVDQYVANPPTQIPASQDVTVTLHKVIHNNGPWGPAAAYTVTVVTAPADCTVNPAVHTQQFYPVPVCVDILHHEPFVIHCTQLGPHTFTFADSVAVAASEPHVRDLVSGNNSKTTELTVEVVQAADIKITSEGFVDRPAKIPTGTDVDITLRKHIQNDGPYEPVNIGINATGTAPAGCTIVKKSGPTSLTAVHVGVDQVVDEVWTINCVPNGPLRTFIFDNSISVTTPHVYDLNQANNAKRKYLTVEDPAYPYSGSEICDGRDNNGDTVIDEGWDLNGNGIADCLDPDLNTDKDGLTNDVDQDDDGDGWSDAAEGVIHTDPLSACPLNPDHDAWPPDINNNRTVNILDVARFREPLSGPYNSRYDLNADGKVNILDVGKYRLVIGASCTP
jgi:hypothetical protein